MEKEQKAEKEKEEINKAVRCKNSPDGFHHSQRKDLNTIPACIYCGRIM